MDGTGVVIAGAGVTRHGFFAARDWKDLVVEAAYAALDDAGIAPGEVSAGFVSVSLPETFEQQNLGAIAADELGLAPAAFSQVGAACAGGTVALRNGVAAVASRAARAVLVIGVEKQSDAASTADSMLHFPDAEYEAPAGFDYVDLMALMHDRYARKYGASHEAIAQWVVQDRWYAQRNPKAIDYGRATLTVAEVLDSPVVSRPITRAACGRACDGASAVVLMGAADAPARCEPVEIAGIAQATGPNGLAAKFGHPASGGTDIAEAVPTAVAAKDAYAQAGIEPQHVRLAQVHDCFSVMGPLHMEGLGIFPPGKAAAAVADGETAPDGRCPANTDGGRIGLGHPTGATGVSIAVESAMQLRGRCGDRQVPDADIAVCQSMGGSNSTSAVAVLRLPR
ncbi:thiolase family protein [Streptomyces sp. HC44]|uniref:Thiolase family protein n=1 Tax=Streptomyces scabichelini TaxID=2711217 RepID=A0A6G4VBR5_9ACTN|nr:thiolase family protein [Streptomyces scabichelini]NGO11578.1 thiolase family protein [Streptomyces scabichelini]